MLPTPAGLPAAAIPKSDVAVADALCLPYRHNAFDAALCIAVLHHISSPARRIRLLQQIRSVLAVGGRALVTVWACEQENLAKTLHKWHKIPEPSRPAGATISSTPEALRAAAVSAASPIADASLPTEQQGPQPGPQSHSGGNACPTAAGERGAADSCSLAEAGGQPEAQDASGCLPASPSSSEPPTGSGDKAAVGTTPDQGSNYFVPWHVPFHRAESRKAMAASAAASDSGSEAPQSHEGVAHASPRSSAPTVDEAKGTVVFQRYYHLFAKGELESLVSSIQGVAVVESYYDRSNWCVVFEKTHV